MRFLLFPLLLVILLGADPYFYLAVKTLTSNPYILQGYWAVDIFVVAWILIALLLPFPEGISKILKSGAMALFLIILVPKAFAVPVLLIEDAIRAFIGFPPAPFGRAKLRLQSQRYLFLGLYTDLPGASPVYGSPGNPLF
ncbi:hypothetical protein [Mucilaginibacter metallidurans]|uniref:hypothetical protein n=1 Tax=Mucilaginibacter sp. P4 TaxID=3383180 RepID=UPI001FCAA48C|nr:hypothetical protein [Mucilaginibacter gossypii]